MKNSELDQINKRIAQLNRAIEPLWWKCFVGLGYPNDYKLLDDLKSQVNIELGLRESLISERQEAAR